MFYDGLIHAEEAHKICEEHSLVAENFECQIIKAKILLEIGDISEPIEILQRIEERGELTRLSHQTLVDFYSVKLEVNKKIRLMVDE